VAVAVSVLDRDLSPENAESPGRANAGNSDSSREPVLVNRRLIIHEDEEQAVPIPRSLFDLLLRRLDECKDRGWSDVWLAVAGIGGGLLVAALVAALTLPAVTSPAEKATIWMLVVLGGVILILCLGAYFSQRGGSCEKIDHLKEDLERYRGRA
jgi:hypothetical protein